MEARRVLRDVLGLLLGFGSGALGLVGAGWTGSAIGCDHSAAGGTASGFSTWRGRVGRRRRRRLAWRRLGERPTLDEAVQDERQRAHSASRRPLDHSSPIDGPPRPIASVGVRLRRRRPG